MWRRVIVKYAPTITAPSAVQHMEVGNSSEKAQAFLVVLTEGANEGRRNCFNSLATPFGSHMGYHTHVGTHAILHQISVLE